MFVISSQFPFMFLQGLPLIQGFLEARIDGFAYHLLL